MGSLQLYHKGRGNGGVKKKVEGRELYEIQPTTTMTERGVEPETQGLVGVKFYSDGGERNGTKKYQKHAKKMGGWKPMSGGTGRKNPFTEKPKKPALLKPGG